MNALHELDLNREYFSPKSRFFGRHDELRRLISILGNEEGSTVLISGDRGSGKSSLIHEAMKRSSRLKSQSRKRRFKFLALIWAWAKIDVVILDVPLLATNTTREKSRETVLRMIVHTLLIEYKSKSIYQKMRTPISYWPKLKQLERTLKYSKVIKKRNGGITMPHKDTSLSLGIAHEYELDLTYADIELLLREFFRSFSAHMDFYIVFDELDKFEASSGAGSSDSSEHTMELKKPHEFIRELKNLFTTSNAKFIFTSTESYYQEVSEVEQDVRLSPLDYKYSIFTHKILVSHFDPESYENYIDYLLKPSDPLPPSQADPYEILKYKLMWITDLYPLATKKKVFEVSQSRDDGSMYIDLVSIETSLLTRGDNVDSLMYTLHRAYEDHSSSNDFYYNRILYKSLKYIAELIVNDDLAAMHKGNAFALLYRNSDFADDKQKKQFFFTDQPQMMQILLDDSVEEWKAQLMRRDSIFKDEINKALTIFLAYLDIVGFITITQSSTDVRTVKINQESGDISLRDVEALLQFPLEDIRRREKRQNKAIKGLIDKAKNANVGLDSPNILLAKYNRRREGAMSLAWNFHSLLTIEEKALNEQEAMLNNKISAKIMGSLEKTFVDFLDEKRRRSELIFIHKRRRYQVLVSPHKEGMLYILNRKDIDQVICINPSTNWRSRTGKSIIYFDLKKDMSDYDSVMMDLKAYLLNEFNQNEESKPDK